MNKQPKDQQYAANLLQKTLAGKDHELGTLRQEVNRLREEMKKLTEENNALVQTNKHLMAEIAKILAHGVDEQG